MKYEYKTRIHSESNLYKDPGLDLEKNKLHKIKNVLRLKTGDKVSVFNDSQGEWLGKCKIDKNENSKIICEKLIRKGIKEKGPWLIFSPLKFGRMEWLVEKATECGVERLLPAIMNRSVAKKINIKKLREHCISAAEQSERISIPEIDVLKSLKDQIEFSLFSRRVILFCDENVSTPLISHYLKDLNAKNVAIVIGPEGGFDEGERKYLNSIDNIMICSLGSRILRADTAALVTIALIQMK